MNNFELNQVVRSNKTGSNFIVKGKNRQTLKGEILVRTIDGKICFNIQISRVVAALDEEGRLQLIHPISNRLLKGRKIGNGEVIDVEVVKHSVKQLPTKVPTSHMLSKEPVRKEG